MKTKKRIPPTVQREPRGLKKAGVRSAIGARRRPVKAPGREGALEARQVRLEGMVHDLSRMRNHLGETIRRQTDLLNTKNGQLRNGTDRLHRSDEQLQLLTRAIASASDGVFIIGAQKPKYPVTYANPSFRKMTGHTQRKIIGRNFILLCGMGTDHRVVAEIEHAILQGKYYQGEILRTRKRGDNRWYQLRIAPVRGVAGVVTHYVGIQTDVTLMRQRDLEIKEQREEILHVTRVGKLAEFVSSLAHEISQPLTAILAYAQAAKRLLSKREPVIREILEFIISDDQRAVEVIRRMRALLKKSEPEMKPLDLNALINETLGLVATDATIRKCILTVDLERALPLIRGDRVQLQQVLLNLFSNSFDALEDAPLPRKILIRTSRKKRNTILVTVRDTGCGIPVKNLPKLFKHFFTNKPDGLGMGLSISRSIVMSHGGRLEAKNNSGRGAIFHFTLPVANKDSR